MTSFIGLGALQADVKVYIANRPPLDEFINLDELRPLQPGEVKSIADTTGNHWRKIFNCFAKVAFYLDAKRTDSWQTYRDDYLLQSHSREQLLFSPPQLPSDSVHIIAGRTYLSQLDLDLALHWLDPLFAVDRKARVIVSPYFDYRQLTNQRIEQLVSLILELN